VKTPRTKKGDGIKVGTKLKPGGTPETLKKAQYERVRGEWKGKKKKGKRPPCIGWVKVGGWQKLFYLRSCDLSSTVRRKNWDYTTRSFILWGV